MRKTLKEIARITGGEIVGDANTLITGISGIREAEAGDLTFLSNPKYAPLLDSTRASAIITSRQIDCLAKPIIRTDNPSLAFAKVISAFSPQEASRPRGVHKTAIVAKKAKLGKGVAVGAYCVIEDGVSVGDNTVIYPGCFIGHSAKIGKNGLVYPNVTLRERVIIGDRVIIHSGTVIGSDGFGFVNVDGEHRKIPQVGIVEICDDVEIGSCVTIDRARFDKTVIGRGTKIDNLVQIAHNVVVGENSLIVSQAGISGSTVIGNNVIIAGQAGLVGHITIGDGAVLAAQAGITKSVPPNTMVSGYPARPHEKAKIINACVQNLPKLYQELKELKKKIEELEKKNNG
jgi:UDP-3-O-[3-hydroxymyristoyl] glucosamine N-acyltransferase